MAIAFCAAEDVDYLEIENVKKASEHFVKLGGVSKVVEVLESIT